MTQDTSINLDRVKAAVNELLLALGEDPEREGLLDTPRRIAEMYAEIFGGLAIDPAELPRRSASKSRTTRW